MVTNLASLCVNDPARDGDACGLVHKTGLCDYAKERHGRHD